MDSLATKLADFGPNGWGAKALRVLACLAVRSVVVAARIMIAYCGVGVPRFSFAASDLLCSFFVACESKRLQASGFAAGDCRQMLPCRAPLLRACTSVAKSLEELVLHKSATSPVLKLRATPLGHVVPQSPGLVRGSAHWIVALLGSTRLASAGRRAASRCACEAASSRPALRQYGLDDSTSGLDAPHDVRARAQPTGQRLG